jgi:hypothetical protein
MIFSCVVPFKERRKKFRIYRCHPVQGFWRLYSKKVDALSAREQTIVHNHN